MPEKPDGNGLAFSSFLLLILHYSIAYNEKAT
jgi:hypothetical protein